jgi:DNA repair protein RecO (recombination protein O)
MLPPLLRAVVLRTRPFSETSLWVRLYSESHGKVSGLAKGARRGRERFYTPLIEVEAKGYPPRADERGLWTLARPELLRDWRGITADPDRLAYAWSLLELIDLTIDEAHPQLELYESLTAALDQLSSTQSEGASSVLAWFILRLIHELGYSLQYDVCPRCNNPLVFPVGALVSSAGGVLCRNCSPPGAAPLDQNAWEVLVTILTSDTPPDMALRPALRDRLLVMLLDYLSYHTERPIHLKSLSLLRDHR